MSTINKFIEHAEKHGGASFNLVTGELNPDTGYIVSLLGHERKVQLLDCKEVRDYVADKSELLAQEKYFLGVWFNDQDQFWYLDINEQFTDMKEAVIAGVDRNQQAIWDCGKGESIFLTQGLLKDMWNDDLD